MCSPALCRQCNKVTYTGCGSHAAQILAQYPPEQQCTCR